MERESYIKALEATWLSAITIFSEIMGTQMMLSQGDGGRAGKANVKSNKADRLSSAQALMAKMLPSLQNEWREREGEPREGNRREIGTEGRK